MGPSPHRRAQIKATVLGTCPRCQEVARRRIGRSGDIFTLEPESGISDPADGKLHKEQDVPPRFACDRVPAEGRNRNSQGAQGSKEGSRVRADV